MKTIKDLAIKLVEGSPTVSEKKGYPARVKIGKQSKEIAPLGQSKYLAPYATKPPEPVKTSHNETLRLILGWLVVIMWLVLPFYVSNHPVSVLFVVAFVSGVCLVFKSVISD